jgi:hypothetical protein
MAVLDSGEPFGLPRGTVRGIIALAFVGVTLEQFVALGHAPDVALLAVTTLIVGNYFGARGSESAAIAAIAEVPLAAPVVGGDEPA